MVYLYYTEGSPENEVFKALEEHPDVTRLELYRILVPGRLSNYLFWKHVPVMQKSGLITLKEEEETPKRVYKAEYFPRGSFEYQILKIQEKHPYITREKLFEKVVIHDKLIVLKKYESVIKKMELAGYIQFKKEQE